MDGAIRILRAVVTQLCEQGRAEPQRECCGLLAGSYGTILRAFPATNVASDSATRYEIAAEELFRLMREIRGAGLEMAGIYHSHPNSENIPSVRDVERAFYPDAAYFIISPLADAPETIRAFSIRGGRAFELEIQII